MIIVNENFDHLKHRLSQEAWARIKSKAQWERISLSAVVLNYPDLLPKRLQPLAASCFVSTHIEWLEAREKALTTMLTSVQRQLREGRQRRPQ